ncbi:cyclopropane-fatty-acyl-phospholipid synthase [Altererythrobacter xiamenensis]|uniref:Cyclopropane-fatty-acyl-phospholipid synthase n=1 Tax=Altererythrobacter xiamenensis TaxID=1316679 RepID=A0A1Y6E5N8_9SPHN|nr:cyclopropane-fatty-acyl-phospholipid synthase family protein [Altererythrobacter xiamenensis]SMQ58067.1 cyclopropane-fatty-acyl-phospholipid synthase [Altererythrobacter xiamenensis]
MWLLDKFLKTAIKHGQLIVTDHDGKEYSYGPGGGDYDERVGGRPGPIRIRLTNKKSAAHIARYPQLGAGEAFMWGWLVVEEPHDIRDMILFVTMNAKSLGEASLKPKGPFRRGAQKLVAKLDGINLRASARKNAEHTYNLTRQLYERFLDEDRQYTMAYYREEDPSQTSLEQAQMDKKAHLAAKLYMKRPKDNGGKPMKVLDIGCGWGGFALYLNKMYDCEVLGVALAPDQIAFCKERAEAAGVADKVKFALMDYRDVETEDGGRFDRISSVGLLEHVGTIHYPQFFEHTNRLLKPDGVMVSHCCGRAGPPGFTDAWTRKYIFPGGYIPALSELVTQSERYGWQVMDVEAMRFHYSHTLEEWYARTVMHREEITAMYDEEFYRMWLFYLAGAEQSFRNGTMVNWQLQYVKDRAAIPMTREYIHEESARLREVGEIPDWRFDPGLKEAAE